MIVGDSFVGKSCFVERFVHDSCMESIPTTMSFAFNKTNRIINLQQTFENTNLG